MHTSTQLFRSGFQLEINGQPAELEFLFPEWDLGDRFGIVVNETLGSLGASVAIQAAVSNFYEANSDRRGNRPVYPEIYVFHVGGPHGDHNNFDFWPPRKEVFLPRNNPVSLLEAINTTAITRLMLPEGRAGEPSALASEWSTWAEAYAARDRLRSCFAYSPSGTATGGKVRLWSTDPRVEDNPSATFDPWLVVQNYLDLPEAEYMAYLPGPSVPADIDTWAASVKRRLGETSDEVRRGLAQQRQESLAANDGVRIETYRSISTEQALILIAGLD